MDLIQPSGEQPNLDEIRAQFEQWRHSRDKGKAIPEALWEAAASLYPAYSLHRISRALRLNHTKLKQYAQEPSPDLCTPTASFIELGFSKPALTCQCSVEMHGCANLKLTTLSTDLLMLRWQEITSRSNKRGERSCSRWINMNW